MTRDERRQLMVKAQLLLDDGGSLATARSVQTLRAAARDPVLWEQVSPSVQAQLTLPLAQMEKLGGTLDDLLAELQHACEVLAHPHNATRAMTMTAMDFLQLSLDDSLQRLAETARARGQAQQRGNSSKTVAARRRVAGYRARIDARGPGQTQISVIRQIAREESTKERKVTAQVILDRLNRSPR